MRCLLVLAALLALAAAVSAQITIASNGQLNLVDVAQDNNKYVGALSQICYNVTGTGVADTQTYPNPTKCQWWQQCIPDNTYLTTNLAASPSYSCFDCDSSCDCGNEEICLPQSQDPNEAGISTNTREFSARFQCTSFKSLVGATCKSDAYLFVKGGTDLIDSPPSDDDKSEISGRVNATQINSARADITAGSNEALYLEYQAALPSSCAVWQTQSVTDDSTPAQNWVTLQLYYQLACVDGRCRACDPYAINGCGGCNNGCTGPTDRSHTRYCKSNGSTANLGSAPSAGSGSSVA